MSVRISVYMLRVMGDDEEASDDENQRVADEFSQCLGDVEDIANDHLPDGYYAKIDNS